MNMQLFREISTKYRSFPLIDGCLREIEALRAENEALKQQVEQGKRDAVPEWFPIETAPKDCGFLGYQSMSEDTWIIAPMYWSGSEWLIIQFHSDNTEHSMQPTHWQPIAAAPKQEK